MKLSTSNDYYQPTLIDHIEVNLCNIMQVVSLSFIFFLLIAFSVVAYNRVMTESRKPLVLENFEPSQAEKLASELRQIEGITVIIK